MALAAEQAPDGPVVVAVVCDGVSSSARPDEASQVAAQAALPVLVAAVRAGGDLGEAALAAVAAARHAIADLQGPGGDTSATTFVSAVASGYEVTLCWLGDSRAYWLGQSAEESRLLTRDDSVAGGMIAAGLVDEAAAMASPHAHVLTRWLGGEAADLPMTRSAPRTSSGSRRPGQAPCSSAPTACGTIWPRLRTWPGSRCPRR